MGPSSAIKLLQGGAVCAAQGGSIQYGANHAGTLHESWSNLIEGAERGLAGLARHSRPKACEIDSTMLSNTYSGLQCTPDRVEGRIYVGMTTRGNDVHPP
jgi:hypothetical protein